MSNCLIHVLLFGGLLVPCKQTAPRQPGPPPRIVESVPVPRGHWYMTVDGHAVYCTGPLVRTITLDGMRVFATRCLGLNSVEELHQ
jgi:hypothetical protein